MQVMERTDPRVWLADVVPPTAPTTPQTPDWDRTLNTLEEFYDRVVDVRAVDFFKFDATEVEKWRRAWSDGLHFYAHYCVSGPYRDTGVPAMPFPLEEMPEQPGAWRTTPEGTDNLYRLVILLKLRGEGCSVPPVWYKRKSTYVAAGLAVATGIIGVLIGRATK